MHSIDSPFPRNNELQSSQPGAPVRCTCALCTRPSRAYVNYGLKPRLRIILDSRPRVGTDCTTMYCAGRTSGTRLVYTYVCEGVLCFYILNPLVYKIHCSKMERCNTISDCE